jgi:hypothetical protein
MIPQENCPTLMHNWKMGNKPDGITQEKRKSIAATWPEGTMANYCKNIQYTQ